MRYSGIQPQYFPRLHYFARILNADIFTLRDDCQFVSKHKYPDGNVGKSYQAHSPIKQPSGVFLLNVPIAHQGHKPIFETKISYINSEWPQNHLKTIKSNYMKAPYFFQIYSDLELILSKKYSNLSDLHITTILWGILKLLGQKLTKINLNIEFIEEKLNKTTLFRLKKIKKASQVLHSAANMGVNEKIIALCKKTGADEDYCGGTGNQAYMNHKMFKRYGIKITVQNWQCQKYPQLFPKQNFLPNLSIIDLLMNVPQKQAIGIING